MSDWVVESTSLIEDLMNNKMVMLNQNGINKVVEIIKEKDKEIERLNNIIENFEEELEREINIKEEDTGVEHDRYLVIKDTLETMLRRFRNIKGSDKE